MIKISGIKIKQFSDFPEHCGIAEKLRALRERRAGIETEIAKVRASMQSLDSKRDSEDVEQLMENPDVAMTRENLRMMSEKAADLSKAKDLLDQAINKLRAKRKQLEDRLLSEIVAPAKPEYQRLVRKMVETAIDMDKAVVEMRQFYNAVTAAGAKPGYTLPEVRIRYHGSPNDPCSYFRHFLDTTQRAGYIK